MRISRLRILNKNNDTVASSQTHTHTNQNCRGCEGPKNLYQKWQYRDTAATETQTQTRKLSRMQVVQRCTTMTKVFYVPTRMPVPKSDEDDTQRDTTCPKKNADEQRTSSRKKSCSRIATIDIICFDRVRTAHCVSSVPFHGLRLLHLKLWSQITFVLFTVRFSHRQLLVFIHD